MTKKPFRSFLPVLTMLGAKRRHETSAQWNRRFERLQKRYGQVLDLRNRLDAIHGRSAAR